MDRNWPLYSSDAVRRLDAAAIAAGTPAYTLMCRAGDAAWALLRQRWPDARQLLVACGWGNNGGDGYVLARLAAQAGVDVVVLAVAGVLYLGVLPMGLIDLAQKSITTIF